MTEEDQEVKLDFFDSLTESKRVLRRVERNVEHIESRLDQEEYLDKIHQFNNDLRNLEEEIDKLLDRMPNIQSVQSETFRIFTSTRKLYSKATEIGENIEDLDIYPEWKDTIGGLETIDSVLIKTLDDEILSPSQNMTSFVEVGENEKTERNITTQNSEIELLKDRLESLEDRFEQEETIYQEKLNKLDDLRESVEYNLDKFQKERENIGEVEDKLNNLEDQASNLLKETVSGTLAEEFEKRRDELEDTLKWWKYSAVGSIIILIGAALLIYSDISNSTGNTSVTFSKIAILLPISVAVWFTVANYRSQKRLMREYEFKMNMAKTMPGFRERLEDLLPEENQELVADAVLQTMEKIYTNPVNNTVDSEDKDSKMVPGNSDGTVGTLLRNWNK